MPTRNRRTAADVATENFEKAKRRRDTASDRLSAATKAHTAAQAEADAAERAFAYVAQNPDLPETLRETVEGTNAQAPEPS